MPADMYPGRRTPVLTKMPSVIIIEMLSEKQQNNIRYCGSMAEQLTRNEQVVGSIPTSSSNAPDGGFVGGVFVRSCLPLDF